MSAHKPTDAVDSAEPVIAGETDNAGLVNDAYPLRDAALTLAAEGFRVFPLPPRQKRATLEKWQIRATVDREQVSKWFPIPIACELLSDEEANVAIATGGGLLVLDEDPRHGSDASIDALQAQRGQLPATRTVRTPSGGRHRYFRVRADRAVPNSTSKLGAGLDVRGDGGYVVAPPSSTDKGAYAWENPEAPIADAPQWLIELATKKRAAKAPANNPDLVSTAETPKHNLTVADARELLKHLDADSDYNTWFNTCVAFRRAAKGALDGSTPDDWFVALDEWCARSPKYPGREGVEEKWRQADTRESGYGLAYLLGLAKGYVPPARVADSAAFPIVPVEPPPQVLQENGRGQPLSNVNNAIILVATQAKFAVSYDEFSGKVFVKWPNEPAPHVLIDEDFTRVQMELQRCGMVATTEATARAAVRFVARRNRFDSVRDWLNRLTWDGTRRLSLMMPRGFDTPAERYYIRAGRNMLISMVARALSPGCQVDQAIVLEGPQGSLKSSALRIIGGEFFKELTASPNSKDFEQQLQGVWLGEFAELNALRRTEDISRIKQFITCREDHLRLPYDRVVSDLPRRTVLCGSTNEDCWLHDPTGGRRFIPVAVGAIDLEWLRSNRDQLFAEAVALHKAGRQWWRYPQAAALAEQEARAPEDPWTEYVRKYLYGRSEVCASEILDRALKIPTERQNKAHATRAGITLKRLGCVTQSRHRVSGSRCRPWIVPAEFAGQPIRVDAPVHFTPTEADADSVVGGSCTTLIVVEIIDAMRKAGGWYLRKSKWVLPALWCTSEQTGVAPAVPADVVRFMCAEFPESATLERRDVMRIGEAVIAEVRYHDHGLLTIDDSTVGLIT